MELHHLGADKFLRTFVLYFCYYVKKEELRRQVAIKSASTSIPLLIQLICKRRKEVLLDILDVLSPAHHVLGFY